MYFIAKALLIACAFAFILLLIYKKKLNFCGMIIIMCTLLFSIIRFNIDKNYYDNINAKITNAKIELVGEVKEIGKTTNSTYANIQTKEYGLVKIYNVNNIKIGNKIKTYGKLNKNEKAQNRGQFSYENYYRSQGISSSMYSTNVELINNNYNPILDLIHCIKESIENKIFLIFDEKDAGTIKAMISGDKSDLDIDLKKIFTDNGIAHILAISGLHLSILGLMLFKLLRKKLTVNKSAIIVSIFIIFYGLFINAGASSIRAIFMLLVRFVSLSIKRSYDSKNTLAICGIILLIVHPYLVLNTGFQFSFTAIYSLNIYERELGTNKIKIPEMFLITLFLLPITISAYYIYPTYSIILNLLVIPLMTFVLCFSLMAIILSFINISLTIPFAFLVHLILKIYEILCNIFSKLPFSHFVFGKPDILIVILFYIFLLSFIYFLHNRRCILSLSTFLLFSLTVFLLPYKSHNLFMLSFLSIGQGDSIIIQDNGNVYSIDGGSLSNKKCGENILKPFLLSQRITKINKAFITHSDSDHTNGILDIIENVEEIEVEELILPYFAYNDETYNKIKDAANKKGIEIIYWKESDSYKNIDCLYPFENQEKPKSTNDHSLVLQYRKENIEYNNEYCSTFTFMLIGDISKNTEALLCKKYDNICADCLKVAHHGSKNSTSEVFVEKVNPKYSVISYGKNSYGHPHKNTIKTLQNIEGNEIYKTYEDGEIDFILQKRGMKIERYTK